MRTCSNNILFKDVDFDNTLAQTMVVILTEFVNGHVVTTFKREKGERSRWVGLQLTKLTLNATSKANFSF